MKILLAVDGSSHSQEAVDEVSRRPWPSRSTVRVLSVIQPYTPPATEFVLAGATLEDIRRLTADAEHLTARAADAVNAAGIRENPNKPPHPHPRPEPSPSSVPEPLPPLAPPTPQPPTPIAVGRPQGQVG